MEGFHCIEIHVEGAVDGHLSRHVFFFFLVWRGGDSGDITHISLLLYMNGGFVWGTLSLSQL